MLALVVADRRGAGGEHLPLARQRRVDPFPYRRLVLRLAREQHPDLERHAAAYDGRVVRRDRARWLVLERPAQLRRDRPAGCPLVLGPDGSRLAKRHGDVTLRDVGAEEARRWMAESLGLDAYVDAAELLPGFDPEGLPSEPTVLDPERL